MEDDEAIARAAAAAAATRAEVEDLRGGSAQKRYNCGRFESSKGICQVS